MNLLIEIIACVAILLGLIYTIMIAMFCIGWILSVPHYDGPDDDVFVTIIVPVRNEEEFLGECLSDLLKQQYTKTQFEVIVVDDGSTDGTVDLFQAEFSRESNFRLITNKGSGKKDAITTAIGVAKGELIITTDADCLMIETWIQDIVYFYRYTHAKMIVAPVYLLHVSLFTKLQTLEFMSLIVSAGGSLYFGNAIMCNGASLAYTKEIFEEVNGFEGINHSATGDDVLLMYKIKEKYPDGIKFLRSLNSTVMSSAKPFLIDFINQRKRWASKSFSDLNAETKLVSLVVYFFSLFLLILACISIFYPHETLLNFTVIKICIILFSVKCAIDFLLLLLATIFFKEVLLLIYFLPMEFLYLFYVVIVGFLGLKKSYEWKGRIINEK